MERGKIAILLTSFPNYSETFITNQINYLIEIGFDVTIFARTHNRNELTNNPVIKKLTDKLVVYSLPEEMPQNSLQRIGAAFRLLFKKHPYRSLLWKTVNPFRFGRKAFSLHYIFLLFNLKDYLYKNFDVAHAHFGQNGNLLLDMQKLHLLRAKRTVVSFHGSDLHIINTSRYRKLFRSHAVFTVNSAYMEGLLFKKGNINSHIIPMGVGEMFFDGKATKSKTKIFTILTVARLIPVKGIEYGIRAVKKLVEEGYKLRYLIIGDGPLLEELKQFVAAFHLPENVFFEGAKPQNELLEYYRNADIFLLPGITTGEGAQEAQGLVIQEAQAMKLPVIVTDAGGMPEGMKDGETGFIVPQKEVDPLALKIKELYHKKSLRTEMGEAGRAFVYRHYNNKTLIRKLIEEAYQLQTHAIKTA